MPIQRFGSMLVSKGQFDGYMALLRSAHRETNLEQVMCRSLLSVDWQGYVYDCDFNQLLGLPLGEGQRPRPHLTALDAARWKKRRSGSRTTATAVPPARAPVAAARWAPERTMKGTVDDSDVFLERLRACVDRSNAYSLTT